MSNKPKVAFIGSGFIGSGLAVNALLHGYPTVLQTRSQVEKMKNRVSRILKIFVENEVSTQEDADRAASLATYTTSIEDAVKDVIFIQESGPENLEIKRDILKRITSVCPREALIASSTSQLLPSDLQQGMKNPGRIFVGHPFHPSYLLPLVELCGGKETTEEYLQKGVEFYESIGKMPLICRKEISGYIANRVSWAALNASRQAVWDGLCSVEDMDKALMYGPGLRMAITGQILTISLGVEGGVRAQAQKYGKETTPEMEIIAQGVDEEIANRPKEIGNTEETISDFRDKAIVALLRMQNMI